MSDKSRRVLTGVAAALAVAAVFGSALCFDLWLYFERHPDAPWWTYLFGAN